MEWSFAEQGERPLIQGGGSSSSTASGSPGPVVGGGDVGAMVWSLVRAVRDCERDPGDGSLLLDARCLADSVSANLRPPHAQRLSKQDQRDLRAALRSLETWERSARDDLEGGGGGRDEAKGGENPFGAPDRAAARRGGGGSGRGHSSPPLEIEQRSSQPQQQQLLDEEEDEYSRQLQEEREREIERISGQVSTVNQIYRDLAGLVGAQQEDVDEIENLVAQSHERTIKGQRQLERAVRKRTAKNKCCMYFACFLLLVIVLVVIAAIALRKAH